MSANSATGSKSRDDVEPGTHLSVYGGIAGASLGFGAGPSGGAALLIRDASLPVTFRFDVQGSRFSQTPVLATGLIAGDKAAVTHIGATASIQLSLLKSGMIRPYLVAGGGIYRFQGKGAAGNNSTIANGVFTSTTDGALAAGGGVRLGRHAFVEGRYLTVGDFIAVPVVFGFVF